MSRARGSRRPVSGWLRSWGEGSRRETGPARRTEPTARTSSIARSIALSLLIRRLIAFTVLDIALCLSLGAAFALQSIQALPASARAGALLAPGITWQLIAPGPGAAAPGLAFIEADGTVHAFSLSRYLGPCTTVIGVALTAEALALASGGFEARRIRRKLRPLNDLALSAEAIGAEASAVGAACGSATDMQKFEHLEHAISAASVEAPRVSTGDKDLRSIEIALNGLLRRMQDAKAQQARFVSDASHELRTPLAVIEGYVGMLDRWGKDDPAVLDESIAALKGESAHMRELVEQLLFLARGESGRNALERSAFDVVGLAAEVVDESSMIDHAHRYVMHREQGAAPHRLVADRALIKQALRIIVQNAARYSKPGTLIELSVRIDRAGARVGYGVLDQGMGIRQSDARHIFERFYRADGARGAHREGTGLGLAIAKWIVDAHGGEIEMVSCDGIGTRFTAWFPCEEGKTVRTQQKSARC